MSRRTRVSSYHNDLSARPPPATDAGARARDAQAVAAGLTSASEPLDPQVHESVGAQFSHDFSQVRIHRDEQAAQAAEAMYARAWTVGRDIFFGAGNYRPDSQAGHRLLTHELAHVVQQDGQEATPERQIDLEPDDALEAEAREVSDGELASPVGRAGSLRVQRSDGDDPGGSPSPPPAAAVPGGAGAMSALTDLSSGDTLLSSEQAMAQVYEAEDSVSALRDEIVQTLLPAYRRAVDALDPEGAAQLAVVAVTGLREIERRQRALQQRVYGWRSSETGEPMSYGTAMAPEDLEMIEADLDTELELLDEDVVGLKRHMFIELGPQLFRDWEVVGSLTMPSGGTPSSDYIANEAATVIALLLTYQEINQLIGDEAGQDSPENRVTAASKLEPWRGRPINFRFLWYVLVAEHLISKIEDVRTTSGSTPNDILIDVREQSRKTGQLTDVGNFDADRAVDKLSYAGTDWAITDEDAMDVFEMVMSAPAGSRQAILEQLDDAGKFDRLINNLPWRAVQALHDSIATRGMGVTSLQERMANRIADESGGESLSKVYERNIMENIEEGDYAAGYGWTFLMTAHNALTFGFLGAHDQAYDARQQGYISSDAYWSTTTKAAARSALVAAATAATGGAGGTLARGAALRLGAGELGSQLIGMGVGGAAAGTGGLFTTDVYDQALMGKEGFSSAEDYLLAGGIGAGAGVLTGLVMAGGARYLQPRPGPPAAGAAAGAANTFDDLALQTVDDLTAAERSALEQIPEDAWTRVRDYARTNRNPFSIKGKIAEELFVQEPEFQSAMQRATTRAQAEGIPPEAVEFVRDIRGVAPTRTSGGAPAELTDGAIVAIQGDRVRILAVFESKSPSNLRQLAAGREDWLGQVGWDFERLSENAITVKGQTFQPNQVTVSRHTTEWLGIAPPGRNLSARQLGAIQKGVPGFRLMHGPVRDQILNEVARRMVAASTTPAQ